MHAHRAALALAAFATVTLFVFIGPRSHAAAQPPVDAAHQEARARAQTAVPRIGAAPVVADAAIADSQQHGGLYRCQSGRRTIYQGRPCAPDTVTIPLDGGTFTVVDPHPASPTRPPTSTLRPRMGGISKSDARVVSEKCGALLHRKEHIESQQRAGASARRMTALKRQWHSVTRRLTDLQCSNFQ